jgi:putative transcriptional regulator
MTSNTLKTIRMKIEPSASKRMGRVNTAKLDATTETQIAQHAKQDDAASIKDVAKFSRRERS